jgi:hypothetical protein
MRAIRHMSVMLWVDICCAAALTAVCLMPSVLPDLHLLTRPPAFPDLPDVQSPDWYKEEDVGQALVAAGYNAGAKRQQIFLISKLHPRDNGREKAAAAVARSLQKLQTQYIDLYLLHYPRCWSGLTNCPPEVDWSAGWPGSWRALEELHAAGKVRNIGEQGGPAGARVLMLSVSPSLSASAPPKAQHTQQLQTSLRGTRLCSCSPSLHLSSIHTSACLCSCMFCEHAHAVLACMKLKALAAWYSLCSVST